MRRSDEPGGGCYLEDLEAGHDLFRVVDLAVLGGEALPHGLVFSIGELTLWE